ncbi:Hypothetical predicted protein, partial [Paramuricea clavata]
MQWLFFDQMRNGRYKLICADACIVVKARHRLCTYKDWEKDQSCAPKKLDVMTTKTSIPRGHQALDYYGYRRSRKLACTYRDTELNNWKDKAVVRTWQPMHTDPPFSIRAYITFPEAKPVESFQSAIVL